MLQRFTQVGEYYVMSKPPGLKKEDVGFMDIMLYDEESDKFVKISYYSALMATGLFKPAAGGKVTRKDDDDKDGLATGWQNTIMEGGITLGAWATAAAALCESNVDATKAVPADDAPVILSRPFIEHAMLSAILTVSGQDTGATLFGPSDMQISVRLQLKPAQDPCPSSPNFVRVVHLCRLTLPSRRSRVRISASPFLLIPFFLFVFALTCDNLLSAPFPFQATTPATSSRSSPSHRTCS